MGCEKHQTRTYRFVIGVISIGVVNMRLPTEDIDVNGHKVTINVSDFDHKTMKRWNYSDSVAPAPAPASVEPVAPAPAPKLIT